MRPNLSFPGGKCVESETGTNGTAVEDRRRHCKDVEVYTDLSCTSVSKQTDEGDGEVNMLADESEVVVAVDTKASLHKLDDINDATIGTDELELTELESKTAMPPATTDEDICGVFTGKDAAGDAPDPECFSC